MYNTNNCNWVKFIDRKHVKDKNYFITLEEIVTSPSYWHEDSNPDSQLFHATIGICLQCKLKYKLHYDLRSIVVYYYVNATSLSASKMLSLIISQSTECAIAHFYTCM